MTETRLVFDVDRVTGGYIAVLVVDDHKGFRRAARVVLESSGTFRVVAEAGSVPAALAELDRVEVDLVLMDVHLPGDNGITGATLISKGLRPPPVVLCSTALREELPVVPDGIALGFIPKHLLDADELLRMWRLHFLADPTASRD